MNRLLFFLYKKVNNNSLWIKNHFTPLGKFFLIFILTSFIFGINTNASITYELFSLLASSVLFAVIFGMMITFKFEVKRDTPHFGTVGEILHYHVKVTNLSSNEQLNLTVIDTLTPEKVSIKEIKDFYAKSINHFISFKKWKDFIRYKRGGDIDNVKIDSLGDEKTITLSFTPLRRGKVNFNSCYIGKEDALGLFKKIFLHRSPSFCYILPKIYNIKPIRHNQKSDQCGSKINNTIGHSFEFSGLRDYRKGDQMNAIHWKGYAKHHKLVVKDYYGEQSSQSALLLDTYTDNFEKFEEAVSIAASIAFNDATLNLMLINNTPYYLNSGKSAAIQAQESLSVVQYSSVDNIETLWRSIGQYKISRLIIVMSVLDEKRNKFLNELNSKGIAFVVYFVDDQESHSVSKNIHLINCNSVEEGLSKL